MTCIGIVAHLASSDAGIAPQASGMQQASNEMDLLGLGDSSAAVQPQQQQQPIPQQPTGQSIMQQPTGQIPFAAGQHLGLQRTELENTLSSIRADTRAQIQHNDQLRSQIETEQKAVKELQETIQREKEALEALKKAAQDAEHELQQEKKRKEDLIRELQMYKQEGKHFKQRAESAQNETQQVKEEIASMTAQSPKIDVANLFALSSAPSTELFASAPQPDSAQNSNFSASVAANTQSPSKKTYDPFASIKDGKASSTSSSPVMTLNRLQEEKQARSTTPNIDISDIEAKFPDLSTVEQKFSSPTTAEFPSSSSTTQHPPASPKPPAPAAESAPLNMNSPSLARSPIFGNQQQEQQQQQQQPVKTTMSPSQAKSVAKYGFDLSAFEESEESSTPAAPSGSGTGSLKDELNSLFGSPAPAKQEMQSSTASNFDDIFNVSSSSQNTSKEKKPTFDDMFFS